MTEKDNSLIRFDFVEPSYLFAVGVVLFGAFVALGSDLGLEGSVLLISLVWGIHLSVGLAALRLGVIGLSRWRVTARWADPVLLVSAGLLTSLILAPVSFAIDQFLTVRGVMTDDDLLVSPGQWPVGIVEEWIEVVGPTLLVALLLGFPTWWARRRPAEPSSLPSAGSMEGIVGGVLSAAFAASTGKRLNCRAFRAPIRAHLHDAWRCIDSRSAEGYC